jgi:hypothetical protein
MYYLRQNPATAVGNFDQDPKMLSYYEKVISRSGEAPQMCVRQKAGESTEGCLSCQ